MSKLETGWMKWKWIITENVHEKTDRQMPNEKQQHKWSGEQMNQTKNEKKTKLMLILCTVVVYFMCIIV